MDTAGRRVTVLVPTRDRPGLLAATVDSVLRQRDVDLELVIVDDGSAVPVEDALRGHDHGRDARLRVVRTTSSAGVSAARNRGLAEVRTPWVAFLDDDDLWGPHKLRRQLDAAQRQSAAWACSAAVSFAAGTVLDVLDPPGTADLSQAVLTGNVVTGSASGVLARTDLVLAVGGFDESLPSMEDWDLWIRLAQRSPIARVAAADVATRVHPTSRGHDLSRQPEALRRMQVKHAAADPPLRIEPDASFYEYWARMEYGAGRWGAGLTRTAELLLRHRQWTALRTPVRAALPPPLQRRLRSSRVALRARQRPDLDWSWLDRYLTS